MASALLAPLTIHAIFFASALAVGRQYEVLAGFDHWIGWAFVLTRHAHLVLAYLCYRSAKAIRDLAWYAIEKRSKGLSRRTLLWTVVASAVLGAYLGFIPPVLTGLTGALFVPGMFLFDRRAS